MTYDGKWEETRANSQVTRRTIGPISVRGRSKSERMNSSKIREAVFFFWPHGSRSAALNFSSEVCLVCTWSAKSKVLNLTKERKWTNRAWLTYLPLNSVTAGQREQVSNLMVHRQCGGHNDHSPCMQDDRNCPGVKVCGKKYPQPFRAAAVINGNTGRVEYRRRDTEEKFP